MNYQKLSKLVLLILLIFFINMWTVHHLGNNLWNLSIANGLLLLIGIGEFILKIIGDGQGETEFKKIMRSIFLFFLETPVLISLYGMFFIAGSLVSSVTVLSSGYDKKQINIKLCSEGKSDEQGTSKTLDGPNGSIRFVRLTSPFGRPLFLKVDGFIRYSFDLSSWFGKKVRLTQDLQVEPSMIIRLPTAVLYNIKGAKLEIYLDEKPIRPLECDDTQGSVLIGRDIPIMTSFMEKWKLEILSRGITDLAATARIIQAWQAPLKAGLEQDLIPGMNVKVILRRNDKILSQTEFVISNEKIQDIGLFMEELRP